MLNPKAVMMGQITIEGTDDEPNSHPFRLVIDFPDAESLRKALTDQRVEFTLFG